MRSRPGASGTVADWQQFLAEKIEDPEVRALCLDDPEDRARLVAFLTPRVHAKFRTVHEHWRRRDRERNFAPTGRTRRLG